MKKVINPIRARIDTQMEQAEAMLEDAEKQGKIEVARRLQEIISSLKELCVNEDPLISEQLYNDVYADLDNDDDNDEECDEYGKCEDF